MFEKIKGQDQAIDILKRSIKENKIASSYLFFGPEGVGKFTAALYFAMGVNCLSEKIDERPCGVCTSCRKISQFNHPDFLYLFPAPKADLSVDGEIKESKILSEYTDFLQNKRETPWREFFFSKNIEIRIDSIRMLQHRANLSNNEGRYKVIILEDADLMNNNAANAFLKTLEEPPNSVVIILISSKPESLLPTIHSRCQKIPFSKLTKVEIENLLIESKYTDDITAKKAARIADGNVKKAIRVTEENDDGIREKSNEFIGLALQKDDIGFIAYFENYKSTKNVGELKEIINNLIIWLSDIVYFQNAPDQIVNIDNLTILERIVKNNPQLEHQILRSIGFLEEMLKRLDGNVNPHLVGIEIYFHLKRLFS